jgi:hypothetical protein
MLGCAGLRREAKSLPFLHLRLSTEFAGAGSSTADVQFHGAGHTADGIFAAGMHNPLQHNELSAV